MHQSKIKLKVVGKYTAEAVITPDVITIKPEEDIKVETCCTNKAHHPLHQLHSLLMYRMHIFLKRQHEDEVQQLRCHICVWQGSVLL
jgi:hypothetical protein